MVQRLEQVRARTRSSLRRLLWWVWPSHPTSWSAVPGRLRPATAQITRLTVAAVVAYVVADAVSPGILDLTAPLTALLVVQASTVGTLQMGLVRVGAVLTGVLVAVGVSAWIGLSWWSLAAVIATSLALAKVLRLGDQSLETPISAMLILAVSSPELAAEVRVVNTMIGTVVGIAFSLLVPVSIPSARATGAVRQVARSQAALLDEVALTLADRAPHPEEVQAWFDWTEDIAGDVHTATVAVRTVEESRRLNPRALTADKVHPGLRDALERLERCLAAERALIVVIGREAPVQETVGDRSLSPELRRAFAVVLDDVANALRGFGDLVSAEFGGGNVDRVDELLDRTLDIVRETRAVLTELVLLDVDPRQQTDLWMVHGSVLAAVEQILQQLDLEQIQRSSAAWLDRSIAAELPIPALGRVRAARRRRAGAPAVAVLGRPGPTLVAPRQETPTVAEPTDLTDERIIAALGLYARMVGKVLDDPQRWLGLDDEPPPTARFPAKLLDALRDRALGQVTPASASWSDQPLQRRVGWWVTRIGVSAGLAAAAPRFAGLLADRIPLQSALGAGAAGLAVCATAREHGRTKPADWVPLLAQVLFDRRLPAPDPQADAKAAVEAERRLSEDADPGPAPGRLATLGRGAARAAATLWQLTTTLWEVSSLLDERPRGSFFARAVGKLPVVGLAGGWLDERGGIRKASQETAALLG